MSNKEVNHFIPELVVPLSMLASKPCIVENVHIHLNRLRVKPLFDQQFDEVLCIFWVYLHVSSPNFNGRLSSCGICEWSVEGPYLVMLSDW